MKDVVYLILDCNILLHYAPPDQIDWLSLCEAKEVRLVLYPKLLTEISNNKDMHKLKHIRDRAGKRERWLREHRNSVEPFRPSVFIVKDPEEHLLLLKELGLERAVNDDAIVVCAVANQRLDRDVCVATADGGLEMKLEHRNIRVIVPEDHHKLPAERDPERSRADALALQLQQLQNRMPKFKVFIRGQSEVIAAQDSETEAAFAERMLSDMEAMQREQQLARNKQLGYTQPIVTIHQRVAQERERLRFFLTQFKQWRDKIDGTLPLDLALENSGTNVATNVRVVLETSKDFQVYLRREIHVSPQVPADLPQARLLMLEGTDHFPADYAVFRGYSVIHIANRLQDRRISWTLDRVAHGDHASLPDLCLQRLPNVRGGNKCLVLTISCDELPVAQVLRVPVRLIIPAI